MNAYNHGKPRGKYDIWVGLIAGALELGLLYWGGFFNVMLH